MERNAVDNMITPSPVPVREVEEISDKDNAVANEGANANNTPLHRHGKRKQDVDKTATGSNAEFQDEQDAAELEQNGDGMQQSQNLRKRRKRCKKNPEHVEIPDDDDVDTSDDNEDGCLLQPDVSDDDDTFDDKSAQRSFDEYMGVLTDVWKSTNLLSNEKYLLLTQYYLDNTSQKMHMDISKLPETPSFTIPCFNDLSWEYVQELSRHLHMLSFKGCDNRIQIYSYELGSIMVTSPLDTTVGEDPSFTLPVKEISEYRFTYNLYSDHGPIPGVTAIFSRYRYDVPMTHEELCLHQFNLAINSVLHAFGLSKKDDIKTFRAAKIKPTIQHLPIEVQTQLLVWIKTVKKGEFKFQDTLASLTNERVVQLIDGMDHCLLLYCAEVPDHEPLLYGGDVDTPGLALRRSIGDGFANLHPNYKRKCAGDALPMYYSKSTPNLDSDKIKHRLRRHNRTTSKIRGINRTLEYYGAFLNGTPDHTDDMSMYSINICKNGLKVW